MTEPGAELPKGTVLVRWLALASAAGAAMSSAISLWRDDSTWLNFTIISSFLSVSFVAALWNRVGAHSKLIERTELHTLQRAFAAAGHVFRRKRFGMAIVVHANTGENAGQLISFSARISANTAKSHMME